MRGARERIVHSVKRSLKKMVGRARLSYDELVTILVKTETVINTRPLTYKYDDTEGVTYLSTPCQLKKGRKVKLSPNKSHFQMGSTQETLTKRSKYYPRLLDEFAKRWKKEYLPTLREVKNRNQSKATVLSIGELVIVKNEQIKFLFWKIGSVLELVPRKDGKIRPVNIKVATDNGNTILVRPLQNLVPLEVKSSKILNVQQSKYVEKIDHAATTRPRRTTAIT